MYKQLKKNVRDICIGLEVNARTKYEDRRSRRNAYDGRSNRDDEYLKNVVHEAFESIKEDFEKKNLNLRWQESNRGCRCTKTHYNITLSKLSRKRKRESEQGEEKELDALNPCKRPRISEEMVSNLVKIIKDNPNQTVSKYTQAFNNLMKMI